MFEPDENDLSALEDRLRSWVPSPSRIDRDRMLFEAGRAASSGATHADPRARLWKYAAAAAVLLATGLGILWARERNERLVLEMMQTRPSAPKLAPQLSPSELIANHLEIRPPVDPSSY